MWRSLVRSVLRFERYIYGTLRNPSLFTVFHHSEYVIKRWDIRSAAIKKVHSPLPSRIVPWSKSKVVLLGKLASFSFSAKPFTPTLSLLTLSHPFSNVYYFHFIQIMSTYGAFSFSQKVYRIKNEMLCEISVSKWQCHEIYLCFFSYLVKLATVTLEATRLFQHCNLTSRASSLSKHPHLHQNYEQWIRINKDTVMFFSINRNVLEIFIITPSSYQHLYSLQTSVNWIEQWQMQLACWTQIPALHWLWPALYQRKILRPKPSNLSSNNNNVAPCFLAVEAVIASLITVDWTSLNKKPMLLLRMPSSKLRYTRYRFEYGMMQALLTPCLDRNGSDQTTLKQWSLDLNVVISHITKSAGNTTLLH